MRLSWRTFGSLVLAACTTLAAPAQGTMNAKLLPLRPLLGKTWKGVFPSSTPEKPVVDVSRFELVLNGQAVRNLHSINGGDYGGESLIVWDQAKGSLVYFYFTTAGFYTSGTMREEGGALISHEIVTGSADGITEVKAESRVLPDGRLKVVTQYLKNGQWVEGRNMHYVEDKTAVVRFKE